MKTLVVAEFYPSERDPVLGLWAHRQAVAARDAGAEVEVVVLHRLVPPKAALRDRTALRELGARLREPRAQEREGLAVHYVPFVSPPRERAYARWGAWAAPPLTAALRRLRRRFAYDLVHAHNGVPVGDTVRRARAGAPLVTSVHGPDVLYTPHRFAGGAAAVRSALGASTLVLANSRAIADGARRNGAGEVRVVHLGTDVPPPRARERVDTIVTVGHLVARKRHADVVRALWLLQGRGRRLRYLVIGDGPERPALQRLAADLGVDIELAGQLEHHEALRRAREAAVFAMPSVDEAFGVAYVEAMAAGLPAIGARGEPGPEEIGPGLLLVPPGDVEALAATIEELVSDDAFRHDVGRRARQTVEELFTWERCGAQTVAAYEEALRR
ncbi:MAG TPA: glycosyltransferase family 4 protein [Capillimicrobium sp.]|jgi:glycosyltransferase involved in cell wall biosynthesis